MTSAVDRCCTTHRHTVVFHESESELAERTAEFATEGLALGEAVVAVMTAAHTPQLRAALDSRGVHVERRVADGDLVFVDAGRAVDRIMSGFAPDHRRFAEDMGALIDELCTGGRRVRAAGEAVALLWERGNTTAAIELEQLWDERAHDGSVSVLCAYPLGPFVGLDDLAAARQIVDHHPELLVPASYPALTGASSDPTAGSQVAQVFLPDPSAVRASRRFVQHALDALDVTGPEVADVVLLCSELATNAVLHTGSPFRVSVSRVPGGVRLAVDDMDPTRPTPLDLGPEVVHGRGLTMVDRVAERWGCEANADGGKTVWAELLAG